MTDIPDYIKRLNAMDRDWPPEHTEEYQQLVKDFQELIYLDTFDVEQWLPLLKARWYRDALAKAIKEVQGYTMVEFLLALLAKADPVPPTDMDGTPIKEGDDVLYICPDDSRYPVFETKIESFDRPRGATIRPTPWLGAYVGTPFNQLRKIQK